MRILWDFRLFSYGYRDRGVGAYCSAMVRAIGETGLCDTLYIWGNQNDVPAALKDLCATWIPYRQGTWKTDLFFIPFLIVRYGIDLFHYWIALGPIFRIGMGLFHPCRTCITVYDLGVERINGDPFMEQVRKTWYWKIQKALAKKADVISCISQKTKAELGELFQGEPKKYEVAYLPVPQKVTFKEERSNVFLTLGGAPNKNLAMVIRAFFLLKKTHVTYTLVVCGAYEKSDVPPVFASQMVFEGMGRYQYYLATAAGLVFCSTYEGLGIPLLEAMSHGCPVVASDSAVFRETCEGAARFVDPLDAESIADGMRDVADNRELWKKKSLQGYKRYCAVSGNAGKQWVDMYHSLANG
jgi:glycosyltransferase involved in cell wall biosynthesis